MIGSQTATSAGRGSAFSRAIPILAAFIFLQALAVFAAPTVTLTSRAGFMPALLFCSNLKSGDGWAKHACAK